MLVLSLTPTHTPAAWTILRVPSLIPFLALVTSNERCWVIPAKRRRLLRPDRFLPDSDFIAYHRTNIFKHD